MAVDKRCVKEIGILKLQVEDSFSCGFLEILNVNAGR
jgi:hypothetical protein